MQAHAGLPRHRNPNTLHGCFSRQTPSGSGGDAGDNHHRHGALNTQCSAEEYVQRPIHHEPRLILALSPKQLASSSLSGLVG